MTNIYKVVRIEDEEDKFIILGKEIYQKLSNDYELYEGHLIKNWQEDQNYIQIKKNGEQLDFLFPNYSHLVSSKVKSIIEQIAPDCVQFLPIKLVDSKNFYSISGYYVLNITKMTPKVIDDEKSKFTIDEYPNGRKVKRYFFYHIDFTKISSSIFKVDESTTYFITEELARALLEAEIIGAKFVEHKNGEI